MIKFNFNKNTSILSCLMTCFMLFSVTILAQDKKKETKVIVIEETIDKDGKKIIKTIVKTEGDLSDDELQKIIKEETDEEIDVEVIGDDEEIVIVIKDDAGESGGKKGYLGVQIEKTDAGVAVIDVVEGTPADKAGLKNGDIIQSVDGKPISDVDQLISAVGSCEPGSAVNIGFLRDDVQKEAEVELAERKFEKSILEMEKTDQFKWFEKDHKVKKHKIEEHKDHMDMHEKHKEERHMKEKTAEAQKPRLGVMIDDAENGVLISEVMEGSLAEQSGLKAGDIITKFGDQQIDNVDQLIDAVQSREQGEKVKMHLLRKGKKEKVEVAFK